MQDDQKIEAAALFQEECNTDHFFVGGGRGAVLSDIETALNDKVDLVTLAGEEGSGKTMLCKMLQAQNNVQCKMLFLPEIVESFEDVVRVVAHECGLKYPADTNRADAKKIFLSLVETLREKGESLLLICDEAEKMYLATLERLRKVLDDVNAEGGGLQLLLSGRKSLGNNLEQLALCDFKTISEKQFFLSALDDNETWNYLNFCVQRLQDKDQKEVFTIEAATKIASMGRGNLRLINVYAEESLKSSSADTSFLVLLDHVKDDSHDDMLASPGGPSNLSLNPKYLIGGLAAFCFVLLLFVFMGGGDEVITEKVPEKKINPVVVAITPPPSVTKTQHSIVAPVVEGETVKVEVNEPQGGNEDIVITPIELEPKIVRLQKIKLVEELKPVNKMTPLSERQEANPVEISPVEIIDTMKNEGVATATPERIRADKRKILLGTRIASSKTKKVIIKPTVLPEAATVTPQMLRDPVLGRFFATGKKWLSGEMASQFSIQLMALKSEQAESNLKKIVSQPDYQKVADKLIILRKSSSPPVFFVFYGTYSSMFEARNARNTMPIFLRDRNPYPVSVRGAIEKARAE